ncbi:MAG: dihydropteroate synthase [Bacillota bacterium]
MKKRFNIHPIRVDSQAQARQLMKDLGVWEEGINIMAPKAQHFAIKAGPLSAQAAQILKQEMLSKGGEAAVHGQVIKGLSDSHVVLLGTLAQYRKLLPKLNLQDFQLPQLSKELEDVLNNLANGSSFRTLHCRHKKLVIGSRTLVMGILNVTPDSFSDGGRYLDPQLAVDRALEMEEQGADIIDIGGESTRPGYEPVSSEEEITRLLPVLEKVAQKVNIPISVDTYKASTARAVLDRGADIINDVSGSGDTLMSSTVAEFGAPFIIMHSVREPGMDIIGEIISTLGKKKREALEEGVREENIILDPGIGFSKDTRENLEVINRLDALKCLGSPILIGTSRKSVVGSVLDVPPRERLHGTSATVAAAIMRGADIVRVHDVKEMCQVARMTDAILGMGESKNG